MIGVRIKLTRKSYIYGPIPPIVKIADLLHMDENIIDHYWKEEVGKDYCTGNVKDHETTADEKYSRLDRRNTSR